MWGRVSRISDLSGLLASSLILRLDPPTSVTGDTHLCFGLLAFLSPIKFTHLIPSLNVPAPTQWQDEPHGADQPMTTAAGTFGDLFAWARELGWGTGVSPGSMPRGYLGLADWVRDLVKQVGIRLR
jgi:hypothetical protein